MQLWDVSGDGGFWKVQLDVRDLGGHLDFTRRARVGTLSKRVWVLYLWVFRLSLDWSVVSIFLQVSTLLKRLMSPPRLLLFGQSGPLRCLLPTPCHPESP